MSTLGIVDLADHRVTKPDPEELWLRRQALQIACQLPEDPAMALRVLRHAETLVKRFMGEGLATPGGFLSGGLPL